MTSSGTAEWPKFTYEGIPSEIYYTDQLKYCTEANCFDLNTAQLPFEFNPDSYSDFASLQPADQGTSGSILIQDFFGDFDFNNYIMDFVNDDAPQLSYTVDAEWETLAEDVKYYSEEFSSSPYSWPNWYFVDITEDADDVDFTDDFFTTGGRWNRRNRSFVYFGNDTNRDWYDYDIDTATNDALHIDQNITMKKQNVNQFYTESLIVFGDLYLDKTNNQFIDGDILVTGNLYLEGGNKYFDGTVMVLGETFINLNDNSQLNAGYYDGFTFMAKDNIHFISHDERHNDDAQSGEIIMFMYTEESIYIDAVNSRLNMSGALYARALGISGNDVFMTTDGNTSNTPTRGIIINSLYGYVDDGTFYGGQDDTAFRFRINTITDRWTSGYYENIPVFESIIVTAGEDPLFYVTEFVIE